MAWDDSRNTITPDEQREIEEGLGIKIIDIEYGIIEYDGKRWKPVRSMEDLLQICNDDEPVLNIGGSQWVDINYEM